MKKLLNYALAIAAAAAPGAAVAQTRGVTDTEIVIGVPTDMSGVAAVYGIASVKAMEMKVDEVNAAGGIHGRKLRMVVEDTQYQVPRTVQAVNKLITRDNVFLITATIGTGPNQAAFKYQEEADVPNMYPNANSRSMSEPLHRLKFVRTSGYYAQLRSGIKYLAEKKGHKSVCAFTPDNEFGHESLAGIREQAEAGGLPLAATATYKNTDTNFGAQLQQLRASGCTLVGLGSLARDTILIYSTARQIGWTEADFVTQSGGYVPVVAQAPGNVTQGLYAVVNDVVPSLEDNPSPAVAAWLEEYKKRAGQEPNVAALNHYIGMDLIVEALKAAGPDLTVDKFVAATEGIRGYRDMFGGAEVNFSNTSHTGSNSMILLTVDDGKWKVADRDLTY